MDHAIRRILVIHQGALGDFIAGLPALASIRRALSHAEVTLMGYPRLLELVLNRYYAQAIVSVDVAGLAYLYGDEGVDSCPLGDFFSSFDLIVVISQPQGAFVRNLRKIARGRVVPVPPFPSEGERVHMTDHLLSIPRCLEIPLDHSPPKLHLLETDRQGAACFLAGHGVHTDELLIAIHPGSGSLAKVWPVDRFLRLAESLASTEGTRILIILGPGEEEIREVFLGSLGPRPPVLLDHLPLLLLAALLERCHAYVGNDSGITHMAAASGVPVVALFGPTDPVRWAPRGRKVKLIRKAVACAPCHRETMWRCERRVCLLGISVEEVHGAVRSIIEESRESPRRGESRQWTLRGRSMAREALG